MLPSAAGRLDQGILTSDIQYTPRLHHSASSFAVTAFEAIRLHYLMLDMFRS